MELGCASFQAGIRVTQSGDALADGLESTSHCVSSDRVVGLALSSVAEAKDEEVGKSRFLTRDSTEAGVLSQAAGEVGPQVKDPLLCFVGLGSCGGGE